MDQQKANGQQVRLLLLFPSSIHLSLSPSPTVNRWSQPLPRSGTSLTTPANSRVSRPPRAHILMVRPLPFPPASEVGAASCSHSPCLPQHSPFASAPCTCAYQVSPLMSFGPQPTRFHRPWISEQEHWSGLPCLPPGDLPHPGIEPAYPVSFLGRQVLYHGPHLRSPFSPQVPCEASCLYKCFLLT